MKAVILVPFRADGAERSRNWMIARRFWLSMGLPLYEAGNESGSFERAQSRNLAALAAGEWDVALFADADIALGSLDQADAALMRCYRTGAYTVAYSQLNYLTEGGTQELEDGVELEVCASDEWVGLTWECCFAVRRDVWDEVGGFDKRFIGYGGQGLAFFYACATFGGRERISGQAYHLAHPLTERRKDPHYEANRDLSERYRNAVDDVRAMREILREGDS